MTPSLPLRGAMTALVTPFRDGRIDESALRSLIDWQISNGISGIIPAGTTGEAATLSYEERDRLVRICVEQAAGRALVIAGTGSNNTEQAVALARQAKAAGADAHLSVTPYYNKPPQEGLYQHYRTIAAMVDLPLVLYNVPGRTAVNMLPETVTRLAQIDIIVGLKEACGDLAQVKRVMESVPRNFVVLSGEDAQNLAIYELGGLGCISVSSNVAPDRVAAVWKTFERGDLPAARELQQQLEPLNQAMFMTTNPIPAKTALSLMKKCREEFRLPLVPMHEAQKSELTSALHRTGILHQ